MKSKVFVSGSISIKYLPSAAIFKLDSIIKNNLTVLLGDANGIDSKVQKYLSDKSYRNVIIYYAGAKIRNNIGNWNTVCVGENSNLKGRKLYTLKDLQMAKDADYGMMIWDNKSKGTFANMLEMRKQNKSFYVIDKSGKSISGKSFLNKTAAPQNAQLDFN